MLSVVRLDVDAEELERLDLEPRLLAELAPQAVQRLLGLLQKPPGRSQYPCRGSIPRRARSTRPSRSRSPCTAGIEFAQ